MSEPAWTVVHTVDLEGGRRRLEYWIDGVGKRYATIDRELDTPERRERVAAQLVDPTVVAVRRDGPQRLPSTSAPRWPSA